MNATNPPSTFGTNGYGCVGHRAGGVPLPCPAHNIVPTFGAKCDGCKADQVRANREAFARVRYVTMAMDPTLRTN